MRVVLKEEFSCRCAGLEYNTPSDLYNCRWGRTSISLTYLLYRWFVAGVFLVTLLLSATGIGKSAAHPSLWLIYVTHWGYSVCAAQASLATFIVTKVYITQRQVENIQEVEQTKKLNVTLRVYWVLFTVAAVIAFSITTIYWSLIYDSKY